MKEARDRLRSLEQRIDEEAREYKRRRLAEEMQKLAEEDSSALFPPQPPGLPQDPPAPADHEDDRRPRRP